MNAGLVSDFVGIPQPEVEAAELCRAWGKLRDQDVLIFFDNGARANFITPEVAAKLGVRPEELGPQFETSMVAPGHDSIDQET